MSNYCTNCKLLFRGIVAKRYFCHKLHPRRELTTLCGNPAKLLQCINENWYEDKNKSEVSKMVTEHGRAMQFIVDKMLEQQEKKMTTEEMIKVMQAYVDGKQIEVAKRGEGKGYQPLCDAIWDFVNYHYRIKPEPKYRPLKPEELIELVGTVIVDLDGDQYVVGGSKFYNGEVLVFVFQSWVSSSYLLKNFKHKDGTPVGKLEE